MRSAVLLVLFFLSGVTLAQTAVPQPSAPAEVSPAAAASPVPAPVVLQMPKMTWSGDIRYRLVRFQEANDQTRRSQQLRVRLGIRAEVNPSVDAVIRLATASSATSANQTMGDPEDPGSARRSFGLDLAYIDWNFLKSGEGWIGRVANPFWAPNKSQIIFDADLAFEGVAARWDRKWSKSGVFAGLGAFIVAENYAAPTDTVDTGLIGGEAGYNHQIGIWSGTIHAGNYVYTNVQNKAITVMDRNAAIDKFSEPFQRYKGNTLYPDNVLSPSKYYFQNQYALFEIGTEQKFKLGAFELTFFGDWVRNHKIVDGDRAYEIGYSGKWKSFFAGEAWISKGADSVIGAFTDSDSNGGGTDNKGSRWWVGSQLGKNAVISLTYYHARRGLTAVARDFTNTQCDFSVSF